MSSSLMASLAVRQRVVEWKEVSSRLVSGKFGREVWVFVSAYDSGSDRNETERGTFWNYLDDCLQL